MVKIGSQKTPQPLSAYVERCWLTEEEVRRWCLGYRRDLPIGLTNTTGRAERFFGCFKSEIALYYSSKPTITELIPFSIDWMRRSRQLTTVIKRPVRRGDEFENLLDKASYELAR